MSPDQSHKRKRGPHNSGIRMLDWSDGSMINDGGQQPIPIHWRQTFREIVAAFVAADYYREIPEVEPLSLETIDQIQCYIRDYGATLVPLPEETWESSVCSCSGDDWDALIDLWSEEEGQSDLVLHARVLDGPRFSVRVHLVYVP